MAFESWAGFSLICPQSVDFKIKGDPSSMISNKMVIQIKKCNNETLEEGEERCAPIEVIDEYVRDINVDTWVLHENVDFSIY